MVHTILRPLSFRRLFSNDGTSSRANRERFATSCVCRLLLAVFCLTSSYARGQQSQAPPWQFQFDAKTRVLLATSPTADVRKKLANTKSLFVGVLNVGAKENSAKENIGAGAGGNADGQIAMLGKWQTHPAGLVFQPRFGWEPGVRYVARGQVSGARQQLKFAVPKRKTPPTKVAAVYPDGPVLPENQLRFYLHFTAPMARGQVYRRVKILKQDGRPVPFPFLEIEQELWDPQGKRLTLLCDPGRVKRGLRPREEDGPILEEGKSFTLVIDGQWPDRHGRPLGKDFKYSFRVTKPDDRQPNPKLWKIKSPAANTRQPLQVELDKSLDHGMLMRVLQVLPGDSVKQGAVVGKVTVANHQRVWRFRPATDWRPGNYRLKISGDLEDGAGNSVARPFEVDVFNKIERRVRTKSYYLEFTVK